MPAVRVVNEAVSPEFTKSLSAALDYWQARAEVDDIASLDQERHNLNRAIEFGLALPETRPAAIETVLHSFRLVHARGYWREWLAVLQEAIAVCPPEEMQLKIELLGWYGQVQRVNGQLADAVVAHEEELALAKQLDVPLTLGKAHTRLGRAYMDAKRFELAEQHSRLALDQLEQAGEAGQLVVADALRTLGIAARIRGEYPLALDYLGRTVAIRRSRGEQIPLAEALHELGSALRSAQQFEQALQSLNEAEQLLAGSGSIDSRSRIQLDIGRLYFQQNAWEQAEAIFRAIDLSYLRQTGQTSQEAIILNNLGNALLYQQRFDEATVYLRHSVTLWRQLEDKLDLANTVGSLGEALAGQGAHHEAEQMFSEALALLAVMPDYPRVSRLTTLFENEQSKLALERNEKPVGR